MKKKKWIFIFVGLIIIIVGALLFVNNRPKIYAVDKDKRVKLSLIESEKLLKAIDSVKVDAKYDDTLYGGVIYHFEIVDKKETKSIYVVAFENLFNDGSGWTYLDPLDPLFDVVMDVWPNDFTDEATIFKQEVESIGFMVGRSLTFRNNEPQYFVGDWKINDIIGFFDDKIDDDMTIKEFSNDKKLFEVVTDKHTYCFKKVYPEANIFLFVCDNPINSDKAIEFSKYINDLKNTK